MRKIKNKAKILRFAAKRHTHEVRRAAKRQAIHNILVGANIPGKLGKWRRRYMGEQVVSQVNKKIAERVKRQQARAHNRAVARRQKLAAARQMIGA